MLSAINITMQFSSKPLFENISIKFCNGNRYGLIGANGCGKSTFMKILSGDLEPSSGSINLSFNHRLGKLYQDQFAYEEMSLLNVVIMGHAEMCQVIKERDAIYAKTDATDTDYMKAAHLEAKFAEYGGYTAEARASELLLGLGISIKKHKDFMKNIAPGWKLRVLLAQALFSDPEILLLDEPTNNLDINTIRWLENILNERSSIMIIISHDRHFLNQVCTHIADMDYGTLKLYPGNYDDYMLASSQAKTQQFILNTKAKEKVAELQDFVRRFSANKSKARQATSRIKQIDKIQIENIKPSSRSHPFIRFNEEKKLYRFAVEIQNLEKIFDKPIFKSFNIVIEAGEKVAIIGANGIGKTTLLRSMCGKITGLYPDSGIIKWAENANIGYMPQDLTSEFYKDQTLIEWMTQWMKKYDDDQIVRSTLGRLLFSSEHIKKSVHVLSGGEKGRMIYGKLMLGQHNVLLLDEPTNHMDMESIESLNLALEKYTGTLIFVSHDREFVSSLATRILEIQKNKIIDFNGGYESYLISQGIK